MNHKLLNRAVLLTAGLGLFFPTLLIYAALLALAIPGLASGYPYWRLGTSPFQDLPCTVVVNNNFDTHGTITRSSVAHLTPSQLADLFKPGGSFADMTAWFQTSFEMKACGTKVNGLYDWLMSSQRNVGNLINVQKVDRGPSLLFPFVLARQDSVVNTEYWAITQGQAQAAYSAGVTGPLTAPELALGAAGDRVIRVVTRYGVDMDHKWFLDRDRIMVWGRSANGKVTRGQWKVLASAAELATPPTYVDVLMTSENAGSTSAFDTAPTSGVVVIGANNVNDFETWCANRPTLDPRKRVPFWYQTMRRVRSVDSEYMKVFKRLMEANEYFKNFGDLPLAERNRQDEEDFQKRWLISFFFGKAISANQTMANWQSLDSIETVTGTLIDPGQGGKVIAKRANMIGVYEQLKACDRVRDLQNNLLNFYEWLDQNYAIVRARKSQGKTANSIDWYTDSVTAANIETAFIEYYKQEYGDIVRINIEGGGDPVLGFNWRSYIVKHPAGVRINVITHEFFDDMVSAFDRESIASSGRVLLALEMGAPGNRGGTIYPGMIASNRKNRTLGELEQMARIDRTWACTMDTVTEQLTLVSETVTAVVECPANNLWIEGLADGVPVTTGKTLNPTYGNLY